MVTILALVSAILYGTADFLGGAGSRRAPVLALLVVSTPVGTVLMIVAALFAGGAPPTHAALAWGAAGGLAGGFGLIVFYAGLAAAPMSVVAPVSALAATLLPVGVALSGGERPSLPVLGGAAMCLGAIVLVSMDPSGSRGPGLPKRLRSLACGAPWQRAGAAAHRAGATAGESRARSVTSSASSANPRSVPPAQRGLLYGLAAGAAFGLFFVLVRNTGHAVTGWGGLWPLVAARGVGTLVTLAAAASTRVRLLEWRRDRVALAMALGSGVFDASATVFYVLATRHGLFSLAVVITSLYPAMTVLLARVVLGERMRGMQRAGLVLAALGVVLVAA